VIEVGETAVITPSARFGPRGCRFTTFTDAAVVALVGETTINTSSPVEIDDADAATPLLLNVVDELIAYVVDVPLGLVTVMDDEVMALTVPPLGQPGN